MIHYRFFRVHDHCTSCLMHRIMQSVCYTWSYKSRSDISDHSLLLFQNPLRYSFERNQISCPLKAPTWHSSILGKDEWSWDLNLALVWNDTAITGKDRRLLNLTIDLKRSLKIRHLLSKGESCKNGGGGCLQKILSKTLSTCTKDNRHHSFGRTSLLLCY